MRKPEPTRIVPPYSETISGEDHGLLINLDADDHPQYHNDARALTWIGTITGSVIQAFDQALQDIAAAAPTTGDLLRWDGANWVVYPDSNFASSSNPLASITDSDGDFLVGTGSGWVVENGATARTSMGISIGSDVQAWDSDLDALAALATTGLLARTGAGAFSSRTLTAASTGLSISDGDGVAGNPTIDIVQATETIRGGLEVATQVETDAGTDDLRAITPLKLITAALPAQGARKGMQWTFSTTTTDADPGSGNFRLNNATQTAATFLYIDDLPDSGVDMGSILGNLRLNDRIYIQQVQKARHHIFRVTGTPTDGTGYWKIPIVNVVAGTALQNNAKCGFILFETSPTIGTDVQAYDADLTTLAGLSSADSNFIVGSGAGWVVETGNTARTSLGLGTTNSPTWTAATLSGTGAILSFTDATATGKYLYMDTGGIAAPTFTTRSAGTKIILWDQISGSTTDNALGIESGHMWFGVGNNTSGQGFKWYGKTTEYAKLSLGTPAVFNIEGLVQLQEQTASGTPDPGYGRYWVKDSVPPTPHFTDDTGTEYQLSYTSGTGTDHSGLSNLPWTSSGHTGTVSTIAGFSGAGAAAEYTIGTDIQAYDAGLLSIAGLTTAANQMIYTTGSDTYAVTSLSAFARTILDDTSGANVRTTIGAISSVLDDTTPQLGGSLDANAHGISFDINTLTSATNVNIDWTLGNKASITLGHNVTFTFTNPAGATSLQVLLIQDGTGTRTITFPAAVKWAGGVAPTWSTGSGVIDIASFLYDGTTYYGTGGTNFA